jgi:glycosyltransferase involved in cell wall biosynthesis
MLYSIVIATKCWNSAVEKTINSILSQSYDDFEVVVQIHLNSVDEQAPAVQDPRVRIFRENDTGIYDALNRGMEKAAGKYVLFLGDGDYLCDRFVLEGFADILVNDIDAACGQVFYYTTQQDADVVVRIFESRDRMLTQDDLRGGNPVHTQGLFVKRTLYLANRFSEEFRILGDYEFLVRSGVWKSLRYVARPVAMFMEGGVSTNSARAAQVRREAIAILRRQGISPNFRLRCAVVFHSALNRYRKLFPKTVSKHV